MSATRGGQELNDQAASTHLPLPRSSSAGIQPSTISADSDYGQRMWIKTRVKPHLCPKCQSRATQRSKRRGTFELALLGLLPVRPFRCRDCDWRFYGLLFHLRSTRSKIPVARQPNA